MNWDIIEGNWKQFKGLTMQNWGRIFHDEIDAIAGNGEQFSGRIQEAYGISEDQALLRANASERHKDVQPCASV